MLSKAHHRTMFVSTKPATAGSWYYGMRCQQCGQSIALFKDESRGTSRFPYDGDVLIVTGCRSCKARKLAYKADAIKPYQAA